MKKFNHHTVGGKHIPVITKETKMKENKTEGFFFPLIVFIEFPLLYSLDSNLSNFVEVLHLFVTKK